MVGGFILIFLVLFNYSTLFFLLNLINTLLYLWLFFFKINKTSLRIIGDQSYSNLNKINSTRTFVNFFIFIVITNYIFMYTLFGTNSILLYNHININNYTVSILHTFIIVGLLCFFLINCVTIKGNLVRGIDYIFSLNNIVVVLPYLFFTNTVFTFLFVLEVVSVIVFYNLISSKIWFKGDKIGTINNNIPQNYINMVFFQYWITFFSTIYIIYFYINVFFFYGSSDWFLIQFFKKIEYLNNVEVFCNLITVFIFIIGIVLKLGITPFHLYKVEVYKGIPFISIFFYTTFYFVVFFLFFLFFLSDFFLIFSINFFTFFTVLIFFGSFYIISLLFDIGFTKVFFTYSTVINTVGFLIAFLSNM